MRPAPLPLQDPRAGGERLGRALSSGTRTTPRRPAAHRGALHADPEAHHGFRLQPSDRRGRCAPGAVCPTTSSPPLRPQHCKPAAGEGILAQISTRAHRSARSGKATPPAGLALPVRQPGLAIGEEE